LHLALSFYESMTMSEQKPPRLSDEELEQWFLFESRVAHGSVCHRALAEVREYRAREKYQLEHTPTITGPIEDCQ